MKLTAPIALAFLTVYFVWGSTYFAIRFVVETMPPLFAMGLRFATAGALLYAFARVRGAPAAGRRMWGAATVLGALFFLAANGAVAWAESRGVPSGTVALLVATMPLWVALILVATARGRQPTLRLWVGLTLGFAGAAALANPQTSGAGPAALVVLGGAFCWALGTVLARRLPTPTSGLQAAGMQMFCGGALLVAAGWAFGEAVPRLVDIDVWSWVGLAYLIALGSVVAFSAYQYLLREVDPAKVATYAYVNPVVAVLLGLTIGEAVTASTLAAMVLVVAGVAVSVSAPLRGQVPANGSRSSLLDVAGVRVAGETGRPGLEPLVRRGGGAATGPLLRAADDGRERDENGSAISSDGAAARRGPDRVRTRAAEARSANGSSSPGSVSRGATGS